LSLSNAAENKNKLKTLQILELAETTSLFH